MATHSSVLAWEIPWTEEPGGLESMGLQGLGHDSATKQQHTNITVFLQFLQCLFFQILACFKSGCILQWKKTVNRGFFPQIFLPKLKDVIK